MKIKAIFSIICFSMLGCAGTTPSADPSLLQSAQVYAQGNYANPQALKDGNIEPEYYSTRPDDEHLDAAASTSNATAATQTILLGDRQEDIGTKPNGEQVRFTTCLVNDNGTKKMVVKSYSPSKGVRLRAFTERDLSKDYLVSSLSVAKANPQSISLAKIFQYLLDWLQKEATELINNWVHKLTTDAENWVKNRIGPALSALLGRQQNAAPDETKAATENMAAVSSVGESFKVGIRNFATHPKTAQTLEDFLVSAGSRLNEGELR